MSAGLGQIAYEPSQCVTSPEDVVNWLLLRERGGETPVHREDCLALRGKAQMHVPAPDSA